MRSSSDDGTPPHHERHGRRSIKSNKNSFPRIFSTVKYVYIANIVKGEYIAKTNKRMFVWIGCVEPNIYHINIIEVLPSC